MAELAAGPHATTDPQERGRRQDRLQRAEATFDPLPFDTEAARAYGRIFAAVTVRGRKARGARAVDLLIAATALAAGLPLYTRNGDDFRALDDLVDVVVVVQVMVPGFLDRSEMVRAALGRHHLRRRSPTDDDLTGEEWLSSIADWGPTEDWSGGTEGALRARPPS